MAAIYSIENLVSGRRYVGSTVDPKARERQHWHRLDKGTHHSPLLQEDYNTLHPYDFVFEVLETCRELDRWAKEREWYHRLSPEYNVRLPYLTDPLPKECPAPDEITQGWNRWLEQSKI